MIFVTLGTQDKSFTRLLEAVQKQMDNGTIKEEVVVQAGVTKFASDKMKIYDFMSQKEFEKYMNQCDLLITHGGVGSILTGLKHHKKVIAAARLKEYEEHENDHQVQIIGEFVTKGYLLELKDFSKLNQVLKKVKTFQPKEYESNQNHFVEVLEHYIEFGTIEKED